MPTTSSPSTPVNVDHCIFFISSLSVNCLHPNFIYLKIFKYYEKNMKKKPGT